MNKLTKLDSYINRIIPYAWDDSESWFEFLGKVLAKVNEQVDAINEYFDVDLQEYTKNILLEWHESGRLERIIKEAFDNEFGQINQKYAEFTSQINSSFQDLKQANEGFKTNIETIINNHSEETQDLISSFTENVIGNIEQMKSETVDKIHELDLAVGFKTMKTDDITKFFHGNMTTPPLPEKTSITNFVHGEHNAFPTVKKVGNDFIMWYRAGTDHTSYDGKIVQRYSQSLEGLANASETSPFSGGGDYRDPILFEVPNTSTANYVFFKRGINGEKNSVTVRVNNIITEIKHDFHESFSPGIMSGGDPAVYNGYVYFPLYTGNGIHIIRIPITGGGASYVQHIADGYNECSLVFDEVKFYGICRNSDQKNNMGYFEYDMSKNTFTEMTEFPLVGSCPQLQKIAKGKAILTFRGDNWDINKTTRGEINAVILSEGAISSKLFNLVAIGNTDMGYTRMTVDGDHIIFIYYHNATKKINIEKYRIDDFVYPLNGSEEHETTVTVSAGSGSETQTVNFRGRYVTKPVVHHQIETYNIDKLYARNSGLTQRNCTFRVFNNLTEEKTIKVTSVISGELRESTIGTTP